MKNLLATFCIIFLIYFQLNGVYCGNASPIKHFVLVMLENRAFDHLLGHLKQVNPEIDGLTGSESIPIDPSDPKSPKVKVSFDAPPDIFMNPGHSIEATEIEIWGSTKRVDPPPMNGFIKELLDEYSPEEASIVMKCYNSSVISVLSQLALEYAIFDRYYSSIPGPTVPNRMYFLSGTSYGEGENVILPEIEGYPQRTFFDDLYDESIDFKIYYSDFPICLFLTRLREYPLHFHTFGAFLDDAAAGTLPTVSFIEPRWFNFLGWYENDQHPRSVSPILNGNVYHGEFFLKEIYDALRASPQWNQTALIITYDEHGGLYDHVPPPQNGVPNPDGLNSSTPDFKFDRLGLRIPHIVVSPLVKKGSVYHEPATNHYDHTSTIATIRKMLGMTSPPLTKREAWAATYDHIFNQKYFRNDCPVTANIARGTESLWVDYIKSQKTPETPEMIEQMLDQRPEYITESPPLTDLQKEVLQVAEKIVDTETKWTDVNNLYEGGIFIRKQIKTFLSKNTK